MDHDLELAEMGKIYHAINNTINIEGKTKQKTHYFFWLKNKKNTW